VERSPETKKEERVERDILWLFDFALILKIIGGSLETLAAILVLFIPPELVIRLVEFATSGEITQDYNDPVVMFLREAAQVFASKTHYFLALYLALHGVVKVLLVLGIFAKKKIAYPLFMGALMIFGFYEVYRGFLMDDLLLKAIGGFDFALLILTAHEYQRRYPSRRGRAEVDPTRSF
jgi:uncharacterized membrane protein